MLSFRTDHVNQEILDEIKGLSKKLALLEGKTEKAREELKLSDDVIRLKRELTNLEIERDRVSEKHEREKRDVEHMVGLEKKRQGFEIESAQRDTRLTIREENLKADRERFEEQMAFTTKRFDSEVKYLKELMTEILSRLPSVEVNKTIEIGEGKRRRASGE